VGGGGLSVSQSRSEAEILGMGMSETSSSTASSPPPVELESLASSSSAELGSASFPFVFFIGDLKPSSSAKESYLSQPIQALLLSEPSSSSPLCLRKPFCRCLDILICLSREGSRPWCLSRAVFCSVTLALDCAIAIWEGREGRTDKFALPHFRV